jgi:hypothetical protein
MTNILQKNRRTILIIGTTIFAIVIYLGITVTGKFETNIVVKRSPLGPLEMGMHGSINNTANKTPQNTKSQSSDAGNPAITSAPQLYRMPTKEEMKAMDEISASIERSFKETARRLDEMN